MAAPAAALVSMDPRKQNKQQNGRLQELTFQLLLQRSLELVFIS